jgi:NCAIR mutase (PurE)-related protein
MNPDSIKKLLLSVKNSKTSVKKALQQLKSLPFQDIGFSRVDTHRALRKGFAEVVYCPGKTPQQVHDIMEKILEHSEQAMASRADRIIFETVQAGIPDCVYHETARIISVERRSKIRKKGLVVICCAGTGDIPVAEEARVTAEFMGAKTETIYDAGVAGIHRLLHETDRIQQARCVVAVAGMEGALPSVVGGISSAPVIAVPTSIGYGASFNGIAPLLTMLNSCAPGVVVVNIDNGFAAGYTAALINNAGR